MKIEDIFRAFTSISLERLPNDKLQLILQQDGGHPPTGLADRLLTGLGQPQINP